MIYVEVKIGDNNDNRFSTTVQVKISRRQLEILHDYEHDEFSETWEYFTDKINKIHPNLPVDWFVYEIIGEVKND